MNQIRDAAATGERALEMAARVLRIEAGAVSDLVARLDAHFARAVALILACHGRVIVMGVGKSGHIGRKIAATLASTGGRLSERNSATTSTAEASRTSTS